MTGLEIAALGALGGGVLSFLGGQSQAEAQQRMAEEQSAALREQTRLAIEQRTKERNLALGFAAPSASELSAQQNFLDLQEQILGRTRRELQFLERGLDLTAPGAAEAGRGLFSSIIARTRATQRAQLESQLRQRFGAGYATTSAGQSALQQFDQGTADIGVQAIPQFLQSAYGAIEAPVNLEGRIKARQIAASQGTPLSDIYAASAGPFAQLAGASQVGAIQRGEALGRFGNVISGLGGQAFGYGLQNKFGMDVANAQNFSNNIGSMLESMPSSSSFQMPTFGSFRR